MWKLKEENKAENAMEMKNRLNALKDQIDEIIAIESGINFNTGDAAFDIAIYSEFKSEKDLAAYQVHPAHQEVVKYVRSVTENRAVVDYKL
jgi:hypothetical protein